MKMKWIATAALTASLTLPAGFTLAAHAATPAAFGAYQERGWDQPPEEYREVQRQGFRDGIEAARRDAERHRRVDADDHDRFRRPPVERGMQNDYRDGFRHGYDTAMRHMSEHHDHDDRQ